MYYNKDAFRAAGLNPDKAPASWDELVSAGKKLTKSDGSQWGLMIPSTGYPYWMFGALTMQNDQVQLKPVRPSPRLPQRISKKYTLKWAARVRLLF